MERFELLVSSDVLDKLEKHDLNLTEHTILTLYVFKDIYGSTLLEKLIKEKKGMTERLNWSTLCRVGLLQKLDESKNGDIDNYILTPKGETF
jgi:hypothetical protein